jgi:hypothetical protein
MYLASYCIYKSDDELQTVASSLIGRIIRDGSLFTWLLQQHVHEQTRPLARTITTVYQTRLPNSSGPASLFRVVIALDTSKEYLHL